VEVTRRLCFLFILGMTLLTFLSLASLLLRGRDGLDDAAGGEPGLLRHERGLPARLRGGNEEADLVLRNVDRAFEADACPLPRQLLGGRACPPLAGSALSPLPTSEVGLHEVARHALDATTGAMPWKRQNIWTLPGG